MSGGISMSSLAMGAIGATVLGQVMGGSKSATAATPPPVAAPVVTPLPDDAAVQQAKAKQIAQSQAASGRASTILSPDSGSDKLG